MINENAKKWVNALRSGNYKQGTRRLRNSDDTFCCLGVACDLAVKEGVIPEPTKGPASYSYVGANTALLPVSVQKWLGLKTETGAYYDSSLVTLNDADGSTFDQIANVIESEPKGLFNE